MKFLVVIAVALVAAQALPHQEWELFKVQHNKSYVSVEEEAFRMKVFYDNKQKIEEHNSQFAKGLVSFRMKVNHFTDMLPEEVKAKMNGYNMGMKKAGTPFKSEGIVADKSVDWSKKGAVTPVKNQGSCGSCWSFSTTGSLEGQHFLKTGKLVSLSEQNLVDCSGDYGNEGCNGGLMDSAFEYIKNNGGIDTEESYPYTAEDGYCHFKKDKVGATVTGFVDIPSGDEDALAKAVSSVGPVSIAIDASHFSFQMYSGGVYSEPSCDSQQLDHGVLAVGYGTENGKDYWLVKNSWGPEWGENGFIKMARNQRNQCGVATQASYPLV